MDNSNIRFCSKYERKYSNGSITIPSKIRKDIMKRNPGRYASNLTAFIFEEEGMKYIGIYDRLGLKIDFYFTYATESIKRRNPTKIKLEKNKIYLPPKMEKILKQGNVVVKGIWDHFEIWNIEDDNKSLEREVDLIIV